MGKQLTSEQRKMLMLWNYRKEFTAAQVKRDSVDRAIRMALAVDLGEEADRLARKAQDAMDKEFGT